MNTNTWMETFEKLDSFTNELEKAKSHSALQEFKPLWRIMKSIQLRYLKDIPEVTAKQLAKRMESLGIRDVAPSSFTEAECEKLLSRFNYTCSIDPDSFAD